MKKQDVRKRLLNLSLVGLLFFAGLGISNAQEPFIGEIRLFAGNFAPRGWAFCDGQLLAISSNTALFSILGTTYGGDGRTTFALPDLRGRVPLHPGTGAGLTPRRLGQRVGTETNVLTVLNLPSHNHSFAGTIKASSVVGTTPDPSSAYPAKAEVIISWTETKESNSYSTAKDVTMANDIVTGITGLTGGSQAVNNMQPSLGLNYIIALVGVFPSRN